MAKETFWNGEPTPARRVMVNVGESDVSTWWCASLAHTIRKAVEVTYGGCVFFLDDEQGDGWRKVTEGHGSPNVSHWSLPDGSSVVGERKVA